MPITGRDRRFYDDQEWLDLSWHLVVRRAGRRCECTGDCGGEYNHLHPMDGRCRNWHGRPRWRGKANQRPTILSLAHRFETDGPEVHDPERLLVMCEGCHIRLDNQRKHWATRRRRFEEAAGLMPLFDLVG